MTDYELVMKAKSDQSYALVLFQKYERLIRKCYKGFRIWNPKLNYEYGDYSSEAYIILLSILTSFDPDKYKDHPDWQFTSFFKRGLEWKNSNFNRTHHRRHVQTSSLEALDYNTDAGNFLDFMCHTNPDFVSGVEEEHTQVQQFMSVLTSLEKMIATIILEDCATVRINTIIEDTPHNDGPTMKMMGEMLGLSKQMVHHRIKKMRRKWEIEAIDFQ
jgi:hypothetical protein